MRNIMHDYPDQKCLDILARQIAAMGPKSAILIDEIVMPNTGASIMAVQFDITMMASLGAIERTESEWRKLLDKAGLRIVNIYRYDPEVGSGIIEAVPKS
jgi:demethylsterigmatocystin 6-O-methyltransferase